MLSPIYYGLVFIFMLVLFAVVALYATGLWPFNSPYQFYDPRSWTRVQSNQTWLTPAFDYSPYNRNIPDASIACIYCDPKFDPTRCIASSTAFAAAPKPAPLQC